ncbi:MAG: hypothetical protein J6H20_04525 [Pyramidobacter sp.]|nr:hypothetical protein [Pyramidobacter sp.]
MDALERLRATVEELIAERDEARKLAWKYREALRSLDAVPEAELLPWEKDE